MSGRVARDRHGVAIVAMALAFAVVNVWTCAENVWWNHHRSPGSSTGVFRSGPDPYIPLERVFVGTGVTLILIAALVAFSAPSIGRWARRSLTAGLLIVVAQLAVGVLAYGNSLSRRGATKSVANTSSAFGQRFALSIAGALVVWVVLSRSSPEVGHDGDLDDAAWVDAETDEA